MLQAGATATCMRAIMMVSLLAIAGMVLDLFPDLRRKIVLAPRSIRNSPCRCRRECYTPYALRSSVRPRQESWRFRRVPAVVEYRTSLLQGKPAHFPALPQPMAQLSLALCEQRPCHSGKILFYIKKREDRGPLCWKFNKCHPAVVGNRTLSAGRARGLSFDLGVVRLKGSKCHDSNAEASR